MGDLSFRRGRIEGLKHSSGWQVIRATVPLANLIGYVKVLPSIAQSKSTASMNFASYEEAPNLGEPGGDTAGVTATKPNRRKPEAASQPPSG